MEAALRILMLEDNRFDFELVTQALKESRIPFLAERVETKEAFLHELNCAKPDVILSDHGLPQFDGMTALGTVRDLSPNTPFIFVTGSLGEHTIIEAFERGADDYVLKGRLQELVPAIHRVINRRKASPPGIAEVPRADALGLFKCAVEQGRESVVITTAELDLPGPKIIYVNEAFTEMTGYSEAEILGQTPRILQGPRTDRAVLDRLRAQLSKGEHFQGETYNYRKNGEEFILQWEISPLKGANGEICHFVAVQRDVTERRRAEAAERQRQCNQAREEAATHLYQTLNRTTDAFVSLDRNWIYTFVNEKAGELFGKRPEDLIGKNIWAVYPEGVGHPFHRAYEKALAEQKPITMEEYYEPWQRWFENRIYPSEEGLAIFFRDITEERRQREELRASLERFEIVTRLTQDIVYDWDLEHHRIRWNQNYYSVFKYNHSEPEEDVASWAAHLHPDDREAVDRSLNEALAGKDTFWKAEYRFERGDGTYAEVADRGVIMRNGADKATRMVGAMMDVSEQKRRNRSLHKTAEKVTAILESITDAFFSLDRDWRFTYINQQAEIVLGRGRNELIGHTLWEEFPELRRTQFEEEYRRAVRDRSTAKFEAYDLPQARWLFVTTYPSPEGLSVYLHDITARKNAEEALRASEEFSRRILESSSDCIKVLDVEGRLVGMTEGGQRLMEIFDLKEHLGKLWVDFWKGDHSEDARNALAEAVAGQSGRFQGGCPTMAGTPKYWDVICTPIFGRDGKPERILSVSRDITELKKAEDERRAIEARRQAIVSSALDAIITIDETSVIQDWDGAAEQIFRYKKEEAIGKSMVDLIIPPELRQRHRLGMERYLRTGKTQLLGKHYELPAQRADGSIFPAEISISRISNPGRPMFTGFVRDISRRKEAEAKLQEQEERLRLIVESAEDYAIITLDLNGIVTTWNRGAENIFGFTRDEIVGEPGSVIFTPEDQEKRMDQVEMEKALAQGVAADERFHMRKSGERFWGSGLTRVIKDENGSVRGFLKIARDETLRHRAEQEVKRLNAELEERVRVRTRQLETVNKELEAFTYTVSHDLRAPLRHMKAFGEMLWESILPKIDDEEKELMERVLRSTEVMSTLVDDLLEFSRMSRSKAYIKPISIRPLVESVIESFQMDVRSRQVQWRIGELPVVEADESMLRQVFINLLSNAIKYTRTREVGEIEIGSTDADQEQIIHIRDNGVGFKPEYGPKLFGVFQRLHAEAQFEGTGIGLAIVKKIIERHGGRVWAESELDRGATFYFSLPKEQSEGMIGASS